MNTYNYDDFEDQDRADLIHAIQALKREIIASKQWKFKYEGTLHALYDEQATVRYLRSMQRDYAKRIDCLDITVYHKIMQWREYLRDISSSLIGYVLRG